MEKIYAERLLKLANFLDTIPEDRFYYPSWVGSDWEGRNDLSCGTTACAIGWASTMPTFRRLGLRLRQVSEYTSAYPVIVDEDEQLTELSSMTDFQGIINYLFGPGTTYLFFPNEADCGWNPEIDEDNANAQHVANKIRNHVKENYNEAT